MTQLPKQGLIWLQHKVLNSQSFPPAIAHGSIFDRTGASKSKSIQLLPDLIPPYKSDSNDRAQVDLPNFHRISSRFYRGGQPTLEGYRILKEECGVNTIINLRECKEPDNDKLIEMGFDIIHIPIDATKPLPPEAVKTLLEEIDKKEKKIFVHCYHGSDRTGALIAAAAAAKSGKADPSIKLLLDSKYGFHRLTHNHFIADVKRFASSPDRDSLLAPED